MSTLENTFNTGLPYISSKENIINRGEIGIQGSRPAEVIKLWLGLRFLGLNGIVVKSHGSADSFSYTNAIKAAYYESKNNLINKNNSESDKAFAWFMN